MSVKIVLFLVLEAFFLANTDSEDALRDQKVEDHSELGVQDKLNGSWPRHFIPEVKNMSLNVHPDDIAVIKGAIQKLLGRLDIHDAIYHAPTSPTRSPAPVISEILGNGTGTTSTVLSGQPGAAERVETLEQTAETVAARKLDWFEKQGEQEMEYKAVSRSTHFPMMLVGVAAQNVTRTSHLTPADQLVGANSVETVKYTEASLIGDISSTPALRIFSPDDGDETDARAALRWEERTRNTRRTTPSTRNTLCTDSDDFCRTMCFDKEKYRVSCPTTPPPPTTPRLDMTRLLQMLSSLVADYDTNLTAVMNQTLLKEGYKNCEPTTTTATTTTTLAPPTPQLYDYEPSEQTGSVVAKCYVCGMEELGIPRNAHCADPFAKDLLPPHMPDRDAEMKRKGFRKYCKYMDMRPWYINGSGIWGKWSGGCAVRWVDLSGIYTQRICRSRERPAVGRHLVSKRLAKLEFALRKVDNGCILSPMATLVPFSRGVSLYARLHVCVCSSNWCNSARRLATLFWLWPTMGFVIGVLR